MEDIQKQMIQAIEQMKSNISQSQQTFEYNLDDLVHVIEQMKSCIFPKKASHIDKSRNNISNAEIRERIKCWYELRSGSDGIDKKIIMNYFSFLEFLEQRGFFCGKKAFGTETIESIITKLGNCYVWGKLQGQAYFSYKSENAYLNAIEGRSKEEAQILRGIYPEEFTCAGVIVQDCIVNPRYAQCYIELFPGELLAALKSEKLLYYIFWKWDPDDILRFIQSALDYDKDCFKDYKDELGNNCLHYYLARFELVQSEHHLKQYEIIKSLLLEHGVNPEEKNIDGISYHDLSPYIEKYQIFSYYCEYFWDLYDGEEDLFPEDYDGYAPYKEMTKDCKELGWYKWIYKYLIYTPQSKWNPVVRFMADSCGIKVSDMEEFKELQAKIDEVKCIERQLFQYNNRICQTEDMQYQIEDQIEDRLYRKDVRVFKAKYAPRHQSRRSWHKRTMNLGWMVASKKEQIFQKSKNK